MVLQNTLPKKENIGHICQAQEDFCRTFHKTLYPYFLGEENPSPDPRMLKITS